MLAGCTGEPEVEDHIVEELVCRCAVAGDEGYPPME